MTGETNLQKLLQGMKPKLDEGEFVFCTLDSSLTASALNPLCTFQEDEGTTVIIPKQQADDAALPYSVVCAWITLTVHSSLEAVGLTAAVSKALTEANISCNVVAAYYHDHIFVPIKDRQRTMNVLTKLSEKRN
jgi:uncharacterized protein